MSESKMTKGEIIIIESPYAGQVERNLIYARRAMRDSLNRGEIPFASHLLYTQPGILDDLNPDERKIGIEAGYAFWPHAFTLAVYQDYGISPGMKGAVDRWWKTIDYRNIGENP